MGFGVNVGRSAMGMRSNNRKWSPTAIAKEAKATPKPWFLESRVTLVSKCDRKLVQSRKLKGGIMAMAQGQKRSSRLNLLDDKLGNDKFGGLPFNFLKFSLFYHRFSKKAINRIVYS